MNTSIDVPPAVSFSDASFHVRWPNAVALSFPIEGNERLEKATHDQLLNVKVDEYGLHWPDIDEDLSFVGLLRGDWGQHIRVKSA